MVKTNHDYFVAIFRTEQLLNLGDERMAEITVKTALEDAVSQWGNFELENWTCAESSLLIEDVKPPVDIEQDDGVKEMKQTRDLIGKHCRLIIWSMKVKGILLDIIHIKF